MVIVDSPGIGDSEHISKIVLEYMPQACAFIYVINSPNAGGLQEDRVSTPLFLPHSLLTSSSFLLLILSTWFISLILDIVAQPHMSPTSKTYLQAF